jgi:predicted adenine nucleotide alpha hydrolase (AANH) superfamily ATPase
LIFRESKDESWKKEYEIKEKKKDEFVEKQEISKWAAEYRDKAKEWFEEGQRSLSRSRRSWPETWKWVFVKRILLKRFTR